jgi:adenosylcobinamide-phosphate synthase
MMPGRGSMRLTRAGERVVVLVLALLLDLALGEPPAALHPVVAVGRLVRALERRAPRDGAIAHLLYGGVLTVATIGLGAAGGVLAERLSAPLPATPRLVLRAALLKPTFAVRMLLAAGEAVRAPLAQGDVSGARLALRSLVSRDVTTLDAPLVAAAAIESLAENTSDSAVAPWLAYLVAGLAGAYAYRAANTLDAMVGYRGRYEYLGKAAARLDDLLNLVPARLTAAAIVLTASAGGRRRALATLQRDRRRTSSPNAGWPMSAMAGALGVQLEKVGHYRLGRPQRTVEAADIAAAGRIVGRALAASLLALAVALRAIDRWRRRNA